MSPVLRLHPLGFPWVTLDPFLFCVHHDDAYPRANAQLGPDASLAGRALGQDFSRKDGWSMYHGHPVPGFPAHPHRGFETVTVVRQGLVDHADSLGATACYGRGDVQWLTAGGGIVHAEMFPLLDTAGPNPLELFQIWLNLPAASKMAPPHFTMFWSDEVPVRHERDAAGRPIETRIVAGRLFARGTGIQEAGDAAAPPPPPDSWAAREDADVAICTLKLAPGAHCDLPAARSGGAARRMLYFFRGAEVTVGDRPITQSCAIELDAGQATSIVNGAAMSEFLLLQGRPIGEPVVQHGPFVMNSQAEIMQAFADYRRTQFGGWPWPSEAPVHGRRPERFARHADGREERPEPAAAGTS